MAVPTPGEDSMSSCAPILSARRLIPLNPNVLLPVFCISKPLPSSRISRENSAILLTENPVKTLLAEAYLAMLLYASLQMKRILRFTSGCTMSSSVSFFKSKCNSTDVLA